LAGADVGEVFFLDGGDGPDGGEVAEGEEVGGGGDDGAGGDVAGEDDAGFGGADGDEILFVDFEAGGVVFVGGAVEGDFQEFDEVHAGAVFLDEGVFEAGLSGPGFVFDLIDLFLAGGLEGEEAAEAFALFLGEFEVGFGAGGVGDGAAVEGAGLVDVVGVHAGEDLVFQDVVADLGGGGDDAAVGDGADAPGGVFVGGEAAGGADDAGDGALEDGGDDEVDFAEGGGVEFDELVLGFRGLLFRLGGRRGFGAGGEQEEGEGEREAEYVHREVPMAARRDSRL